MPSTTLGRRLDQVTAEQQRRQRVTRRRIDLAMFTDDEVEALSDLAQKAENAAAIEQPVVWMAEELVVLDRLGAKYAAERRW
jgi:hypothetical protein